MDLIDRQAAIDAILHNQEVYANNFGDDPIDKYTIAIIDNDAQTIAQLPSHDPLRGRWIPHEDEEFGALPRRTVMAEMRVQVEIKGAMLARLRRYAAWRARHLRARFMRSRR